MRPVFKVLNLAAICSLSLAITACGGGGGGGGSGGSGTTPLGGGPDTTTKPSVSGVWVGSYTIPASLSAPTGVSRNGLGSSLPLATILPFTLSRPSAVQAATAERTVHFSVTFVQSAEGILSGSYTAGSALGTISGTVVDKAITLNVNFVTGAAGTLKLVGTLALQSGSTTEAATITGTVTENYTPTGGTPLAGSGPATVGDRQQTGTTGDQPAGANDFTGWWRGVVTGIADEQHENEGDQILFKKLPDGLWAARNPIEEFPATRSSTDATIVENAGKLLINGREPTGNWWKVECIMISPSLFRMDGYEGGNGPTPSWSATISDVSYYSRIDGPIAPTLGATPVVLTADIDATAPAPGADILSVSASFDVTGLTVSTPMNVTEPSKGHSYHWRLLSDDVIGSNWISVMAKWEGTSWSWDFQTVVNDDWNQSVRISTGVSGSIVGNALVFTISKQAHANAMGKPVNTGMLYAHVNDNPGDYWTTLRDQTAITYFRLPETISPTTTTPPLPNPAGWYHLNGVDNWVNTIEFRQGADANTWVGYGPLGAIFGANLTIQRVGSSLELHQGATIFSGVPQSDGSLRFVNGTSWFSFVSCAAPTYATIPNATITLDTDLTDWPTTSAGSINDATSDQAPGYNAACDITKFQVVCDGSDLVFRIDLAGPISDLAANNTVGGQSNTVNFSIEIDDNVPDIHISQSGASVVANLNEQNGASLVSFASGSVIQVRYPISNLGTVTHFAPQVGINHGSFSPDTSYEVFVDLPKMNIYSGWWFPENANEFGDDAVPSFFQVDANGVWKEYNAFNIYDPTMTFSVENGKLVRTYFLLEGQEWNKEIFTILSENTLRSDIYSGGSATTPVWNTTTAFTYNLVRISGSPALTLTSTQQVLATDTDTGIPTPADDLTTVSASWESDTLKIVVKNQSGAIVPADTRYFAVHIRDDQYFTVADNQWRLEYHMGATTNIVKYNRVATPTDVAITSGVSMSVQNGDLVCTLSKSAWQSVLGRVPTGGYISVKVYDHSQPDGWENAIFDEISPNGFFKLP